MPVKFFGQFLLSRGTVNREQLLEALELQQARNRPLGSYAVAKGYLSEPQAEQVNQAQRARDERFGDLAVELGLLTEGQVEELVVMQQNDHIRLGEALRELGSVDAGTLERELAAFREDQAAYEEKLGEIPAEIPHADLLEVFADLTQKLLLRVVGARTKVAATDPLTTVPSAGVVTASISISGALTAEYVLSLPHPIAHQTAERMLGEDVPITDEIELDAVKELCNIICGNATSKLAQRGKRIDISPPLAGAPLLKEGDRGVLIRFTAPAGDIELRICSEIVV